MSKMADFVAFEAAVELIHERGLTDLLDEIYHACLAEEKRPASKSVNHVTRLFEPFSPEEISQRIGQILTPKDMNAEVEIIYQTIEGLHKACPNHTGDWYFTGDYPTPGGNRVANRSFINFMEKNDARAY